VLQGLRPRRGSLDSVDHRAGIGKGDHQSRSWSSSAAITALLQPPAARLDGAVRWASRERRRNALDKLIAAQALALDVTLVTNNPATSLPTRI